MIYGITGHTYGFGKYITERLIADGHSVIGVSRSTGFDLTVDSDIVRAVKSFYDCDVIVNNSSAGHRQTVLLNQLRLRYLPFEKTIINVGSWITHVDLDMLHEADVDQYIDKSMLEKLSNNITCAGYTLKSVYLTWGFHLGNPILSRYPELQDMTTVDQAVDQLVSWNQ